MQERELPEIVVLGYNCQAVLAGVLPHLPIRTTPERGGLKVLTGGEVRMKNIHEPRAEVLVVEELHAAGGTASLRSRAAANVKQARMSSRSRLGKSARIRSSVMPPARYSRTSYTVMRVSRMQGLPPRTPVVILIRSSSRMRVCYSVHRVKAIRSPEKKPQIPFHTALNPADQGWPSTLLLGDQ